MSSKDIKPKQRLGQTGSTRRNRVIAWTVFAVLAGTGSSVRVSIRDAGNQSRSAGRKSAFRRVRHFRSHTG